MSDIVNYRGKCRHKPDSTAGGACWLPKGHHGHHSFWIYRWKRRPSDAKDTIKRLKRERQDAQNEARRNKRWEARTKAYNASFANYYPKDY